jgi:hypothetical protein
VSYDVNCNIYLIKNKIFFFYHNIVKHITTKMITSLIYMTVDSIYLFYWFLKNTLYGSYYVYCYITGTTQNITEIPTNELLDIKHKMEHQDKMLEELTILLKDKEKKKQCETESKTENETESKTENETENETESKTENETETENKTKYDSNDGN